jgi:hypothetical protein
MPPPFSAAYEKRSVPGCWGTSSAPCGSSGGGDVREKYRTEAGKESGGKILIFSLPFKKRKEVMGKCSKVEAHLKKPPREALFCVLTEAKWRSILAFELVCCVQTERRNL